MVKTVIATVYIYDDINPDHVLNNHRIIYDILHFYYKHIWFYTINGLNFNFFAPKKLIFLPKGNLTQKQKQFKKLKQKVDAHSTKFLIDVDNLSKKYGIIFWEEILWITRSAKYGIIFCEQMSWITRSTKWVRLAKCTWSC